MGMNQENAKDTNKAFKSRAQREEEAKLDEVEEISVLIDIKRWKYNGQFINKFLNTCP